MTEVRHFTATGFVVHNGCVLLHWHKKVKAWLPPGGHIDENEDPVEATIREVMEETGLSVEVVIDENVIPLSYPVQIPVPATIMIEDIEDPVEGPHQHIDMIYFCRLIGPSVTLDHSWVWVSEEILESASSIFSHDGREFPVVPPPEDVQVLGLRAIRHVEQLS